MSKKPGWHVRLYVYIWFPTLQKVSYDRGRDRRKENSVSIMTCGVIDAGNITRTQDGKAVRRGRTQTGPRFEDWIRANVRGNRLRIHQQPPESSGRHSYVESHVFIRRADHKFTVSSRSEIGRTPADHAAKGAWRHGQR